MQLQFLQELKFSIDIQANQSLQNETLRKLKNIGMKINQKSKLQNQY